MKRNLACLATALVLCTSALMGQMINLKSKTSSDIVSEIKKMANTDSLIISGSLKAGESWKNILNEIAKFPNLRHVEFRKNYFDEAPAEIASLVNVHSISFHYNEEMDLHQLIDFVKPMKNLKALGFDIFSISDLPKNVNELSSVTRLYLYRIEDPESGDGESKDAVTLEYKMPFAFADGNRREMFVAYSGNDAEEMREDMGWIGSFFPGTYNNSATENLSYSDFANKSEEEQLKKSVFVKTYKNVCPPVKDVQVAKEYKVVSASAGGEIQTTSGTVISIPASAFVDGNGNPVKDDVVIDYREFKDPLDFIFSGIPMTYDSGGVKNTFESAGMFELNASSNGKEVFLAPGKKIDMEFTSTDTADSFNFYVFNDSANNWQNIGKPGKAKVTKTRINLTKAYGFYTLNKFKRRWTYDTLSFQERFLDSSYVGEYERSEADYLFRKRARRPFRPEKCVRISNAIRNREGEYKFRIRHNSVMNPEMNAFTNLKWKLADEGQLASFKKTCASKYFSDIRISESGSGFEIMVKSGKHFRTFKAVPMMQDKDGKWVELKDGGASRYKRYNSKLNLRERVFNRKRKNMRFLKTGTIRDMQVFNNWLWKETCSMMNSEERKMNKGEWGAYVNKMYAMELSTMSKKQASADIITRSLTIGGLGIYNCDQIRRMQQPVYVKAKYFEDTTRLTPERIFVIGQGVNAVFTYYNHLYAGYSLNHFAIERSGKTAILVLNAEGDVALITPETVKQSGYTKQTKVNFNVQPLAKEKVSIEELRKQIAF